MFHRFLLAAALVLAAATSVHADVVTLAWDQNPEVDVAGYRLSYGTASGVYSTVVDVPGKTTLTVAVTVAGGARYFFTIQAYNTGGMVSPFAPEIFSDVAVLPPPPPVPLPAPWIAGDVGAPALAGLTTATGSIFSVDAAGIDIWAAADQFQFVSQPLTGNGEIVARVDSLVAADPWTKAGVMIRDDTTTGARNAFAYVRGGGNLIFSRRVARSGVTTSTSGTVVAGAAPFWVKLSRVGNIFTAYSSPTGAVWTVLGSITIQMAAATQIGLAVTSAVPTLATTAVFSNVAVAPVTLVPPVAPIGVAPRK